LNTRGSSNTDPANGAPNVNPDQQWATSNGVNEHASNCSEDNLNSVHGNEEMAPCGLIRDACSFKDTSQEVRNNT